MKKYKNDIKVIVHMKNGSLKVPDLEAGEDETPLDAGITKLAGRTLKGQLLITFFYAYRCMPDWEDIQEHLLKNHGRELDRDTVQKYARQAMSRISDNAEQLKDLVG